MSRFLALLLTLAMVLPMTVSMIPSEAAETVACVNGWDFEDASQISDFSLYQSGSSKFSIADGVLSADGTDGEMKAMVNTPMQGLQSVSVDIIPGETGFNVGIYVGASEAGNSVDQVNALAFLLESNKEDANCINMIVGSFPTWTEHTRMVSDADHSNALYTDGVKKPINLRLDFDDDNVTVTLSLVEDPAVYTQWVYYCDTAKLVGQVGLRAFCCDASFDNFSVSYQQEIEQSLMEGLTFTGANVPLVQTDSAIAQIPGTIEMWVKMNPRTNTDGTKYRQPLISSIHPDGPASSTAGDFELLTGTAGTLWWYEVTDKTIEDTTSAQSYEWKQLSTASFWNSEWTHVAVTREEGCVTLYVNGEKISAWESDLIGQAAVPTHPITFGYSVLANDTTVNNLDGSIGDVRLWSNARTQEEIRQDMYNGIAGTETGLMHYWKLDEQTGTAFYDSAANGINGTIVSAVSLEKEIGLEFTGANEFVATMEKSTGYIPQALELWVKIDKDSKADQETLIAAYSGTTQAAAKSGDWYLGTNAQGALRWVEKNANGQSGQMNGTASIQTGKWTHIAVVRSEGDIKFYINGVEDTVKKAAGVKYITLDKEKIKSVTPPSLGHCVYNTLSYNNYLDGALSDIRLWDVDRSQAQIVADMNKTLTGTEEGLISYWKLDEKAGTAIADSASAGNTGTITGNTTIWQNKTGLDFAGVNSPIAQMESAVGMIPKTVELWVKLDGSAEGHYQSIINAYSAKTQAPALVGDWSMDVRGGKLRWADKTSLGQSGQLFGASVLPTDQWVHLAVTRESGKVNFYINGVLDRSVSYSTYEENTVSVTVPKLGYSIFDTHQTTPNYLDGALRDVRIWNVTKTEAEIKASMNAALTGTEEGLMHYWKLDAIQDRSIEDCASDNDIILGGAYWSGQKNQEQEEVSVTNTGMNNSAGAQWRTLMSVNEKAKSVEAWVKVPTAIGNDRRLTIISAYPNQNFHMDVYTNGRPRLWFENAEGTGAHFVAPVDVRTNRWTHIAWVIDEDAGTITCYINGEAVYTNANAGAPLTVQKLYVGRDNRTGWQYPFMGQVADVRLWNKTLTADEVKQSMTTQNMDVQDGLVLNLPLDEGDYAESYRDLSGNENTVMNMPDGIAWIDVEKKPSDYSIAIIPDQQYLTASYVDKLNGIYQWIADNAEAENMQMVINLGDITDNGSSTTQWQRALDAYNLIGDKVPYILVAGNHDYKWNTYRDATNLNTYFPLSMFKEQETYGGAYAEDDVLNTWQQFEVCGNKYLILALEFCPRDAVLEWANEVVAAHPYHQVIVVTHAYVDHDGTFLEGNDSFGADTYSYVASETEPPNDAAEMWDKFVRKHENIVMVLSGHIFASTDVVVKTDIGDHGNTVKQFLIDAQWLDSKLGGLGLVAMMNFSNGGKDVEFTYYCPYTGKYMNFENQFTFTLPEPKKDPIVQVMQQVSLGDDLAMNFVVEAEPEVTVNVTFDGNTKQYDLSSMIADENGKYTISVNLAAAQMTEEIYLEFIKGEAVILEKTYSVRSYAEAILEGDHTENTKNLVRGMLNYGAKAQLYFDVNTDDLANAGYELEETTLPAEAEPMAVTGSIGGLKYYGATLVLRNQIAVRIYFTGSIEGVSFGEYEVTEKDGMYYIEVADINPQEYSTPIVLTAAKGEKTLTVSYSPLNYILRMSGKDSASAELKAMVNALYGYHAAAVQYLAE